MHRRSGGKGGCHQRGGAVNIKAFFVDALTAALELNIGTPDDVLRQVTPEVLSIHLPRPLWARLLTACLGAPRVDAQLIVETIGIPNLCEHVPSTIIWACIAEIGARSLGKTPDIAVAPAPLPTTPAAPAAPPQARITAERQAVLAPPPDEKPVAAASAPAAPPPGPSIPAPAAESLQDVINELDGDGAEPRLATLRPRSPTAQRFRQSNTAVGRLGSARRPQAAAAPSPTGRPRREPTEVSEPELETLTGDSGELRGSSREIAVDDSQLVDWQATDGAGVNAVVDDDFSDLGRKR